MNHTISRAGVPLLLAAIGMSAPAQDFFVGGNALLRVTPAGAVATVTFGTGMTPIVGGAFEVDLRDPDTLISAALLPSTGEIAIFRTTLGGVGGTTAVAQTQLLTLPNSAGSTFFSGDLHRAPDGSYVLLSRNVGPTGYRLDRIGLTRQGGIATEIPITNAANFYPNSVTEIAVDNTGAIFLTGIGSSSTGGRIFRLDPAGGNATVFRTSPDVDFMSVEVAPNGTLVAGGIDIGGAAPPGVFNFECNITAFGGNRQAVGPVGAFIPTINELHIDENGDTLMLAQANSLYTLERHGANCVAPANPVIATLPAGTIAVKLTRDFAARQAEFGASAPWSTTNLARCFEGPAPVVGSVWGINLTAAQPNALFVLSVGAAELTIPVDLGPLGAPGSALYQTNDATAGGSCDALGNAIVTVAVPNDPSLIGSALFAQFGVVTTFTPFGLVATNAIHSIVM